MTAYIPEFAGTVAAIGCVFFFAAQVRTRLREARLVLRGGRVVNRKDEPGRFWFHYSAGVAAGLVSISLSFLIFRAIARLLVP